MRSTLLVIAFTILIIPCFSQSETKDCTLTVNFAPSFMSTSRLIIVRSNDSIYVQMGICKNYGTNTYDYSGKHLISSGDFQSLRSFFETYQFRISGSVDSVITHRKDSKGHLVKEVVMVMGNDGITVHGEWTYNKQTQVFEFWSPAKGSRNSKLSAMLLNILQKAFPPDGGFDYEFYTYTKELKMYF